MRGEAMIRSLVASGRSFMVLILLATIVAGGASAQNGKPESQSPPDVPQLIQQLKKPDLQDRRDAARELGKIKPLPAEAIPVCGELLILGKSVIRHTQVSLALTAQFWQDTQTRGRRFFFSFERDVSRGRRDSRTLQRYLRLPWRRK